MTNPLPKEVLERSEACNSPQYHITNAIQPQYVVLILEPKDYSIVYTSNNVSKMFGKMPEDIIGRNVLDLLEAENAKRLNILLTQERIQDSSYSDRFPAQIIIANTHFTTEAIFYRNKDYICIEIETDVFSQVRTDYLELLFLRLSGNINTFQGKSQQLASLICKAIHKIIGFDRIWYCEFDEDGNGYTAGEWNNGVLPSLMHHRFPATDLPTVVRSVYIKNKARTILDSSAQFCPIADKHGNDAPQLDFTQSLARRAGESHLEYLRNMGVASSASFSVVKDGRLMALFGAHSKQPKLIKYRQLAACQYLVDKYITKYELLLQRESTEELNKKESIINNLIDSLAEQHFDIRKLFEGGVSVFSGLLNADGCLYYKNGKFYGSAHLTEAYTTALSSVILEQTANQPFFSSDSIEVYNPALSELKHTLCGILAIRLAEDGDGDEAIVWYRKEHAYDEKWAGNPSQAVIQDDTGKIGPRTSFESWIRTIEGKSVPWQSSDLTVAGKFRQSLVLKRALFQAKFQKVEAEKANAFKSQFLANMSHELRTPLHTMIGFVEAIMEKIDHMPKEKQMQYLELVHGSSERLLVLINDLLDLAKLEAGMMKFNFALYSLKPVIEGSVKEVSKLIQDKDLQVRLEVDSKISLVFDRERMVQVLVNLLSNAAKFTPEGKTISIQADISSNNLKLAIHDQGIGIPEIELEAVFDKFVQSSKTKTDAGGTGLGLSICKEIMQAHHGRIWAENNQDGGASFFIEFPVDLEQLSITI